MGQTESQLGGEQPDPAAVEAAQREVKAMSVKELKTYLNAHGVDYSSCVEKTDLVDLALEVAASAPPPDAAGRPGAKTKRPPGPPKREFCSCWQYFLPENAPQWYVKKLGGGSSGDVHGKPAPEGSLFLIGHVSLAYPDPEKVRNFFHTGLGCGISTRGTEKEVLMNAGASQLRLPIVPGGAAQRWPGEVRIWVENIQTTYDLMNAVEGSLEQKLVVEYGSGINGGEFSMVVRDPYKINTFVMTEAPKGFPEKLRSIGCEASSMKANPLAISDVLIKTRSRADTQLMGGFYKHFFQAAVTVQQYSCMVHFSPGKELHQTLTFREDSTCPPYTELGAICIYLKTKAKFHLAYARCCQAGIVESPATWEEAQAAQEFVVRAVVDPESRRELLPLRNIIRMASHLDCLVPV